MAQGWLQIAVFVAVLVALIKPVGIYMARVFAGQRVFLSPVVGPIERLAYRTMRVRPDEGQDWKAYARSLVVFSLLSWVALYLILRRLILGPEVEGVFTLFAILFFFVGAQFLAFGLLGEYIGRIYQEVRERPRFIVNRILSDREESAKASEEM